MNKTIVKKVLLWLLAALFILVLLALLVVAFWGGDIAKKYVEEHDHELVGREITLGGADVSVLHGNVLLTDVAVKEQDGKTDFFCFDSLFVDIDLWPLLCKEVSLQHIHLTGAKAMVLQRDTVFNFSDIIDHFSSDDAAEEVPADTADSGWSVGLYDIALRHCNIVYKDLVLNSDFSLEDVNIGIPGVYFADKATDVGLNLNFANGGRLHATMKYDIASADFEINTQISDFSIDCIKPYMRQGVRVGSVAGLLDADATMTGNFKHIIGFDLSGKSSLKNVRITDDLNRLILSAKRTSAELVRLNLTERVIHLGLVDGEYVATDFIIDKNGNDNISYFVSSPEAEQRRERRDSIAEAEPQPEKAQLQEEPMHFTIDKVNMTNMRTVMEDASVPDTFRYEITDFSVKAANITLDKPNDVLVAGRVGKTGKLEARWKGSLNDLANQNITAKLTNIDLTEFTPYAKAVFGYRVTGGNMSVESQNVIKDNNLQGVNQLQVMNCTVEKDKQVGDVELKVPLKTALYVVKDKNGKIGIDLPVAGNITSPEFNYKKIVVKTLKDFFVKVGTAPVKSLVRLVSKGDGFDRVAFSPSDANLSVETYDQLNQIIALLKEKPDLKSDLVQQINYEDAATEVSLLMLETEYYLKQNPGKTVQTLELIDLAAIKALPADSSFVNYARALSSDGTRNLQKIAVAIYADSAATVVAQLAKTRQSNIRGYLVQQLGDAAACVHDSIVPPSYGYRKKTELVLELREE